MKGIVFFLLIILLFSTILSALNFSCAVPKNSSSATSYNEPNAGYVHQGYHEAGAVDYHWISGVSQGDLFLLNINLSPNVYYQSVVFYSNLTVVPAQDSGSWPGTHIHQFIADKTDRYLLRITSSSSFNYTIECNYPIADQPMYKQTGNHEAGAVDYHWISGVSQGDLFLLNINLSPNVYYQSVVFYSNLTVVPAQDSGSWPGTHIHQFIADKTDRYLLRITSSSSFNYTIECNHPLVHIHSPEQLQLDRALSWFWSSNTSITSISLGDVDGDDQIEIVTGGYYNDGTRNVAQLVVLNGVNLAVENVKTWYWNGNTIINSVALGDVDGDDQIEIVTGGYYNDGTRNVAQLVVLNGVNLAVENVKTWYWNGNTIINSIAVSDVDSDGQIETVTGGSFFDGSRDVAQLCVWSSSLALENVKTWFWNGNTVINSVAAGDVDGDGVVEVVTGGYYNDGVRKVAQLIAWTGHNLAVDRITVWYWIDDTVINSVAIGDVDSDCLLEIVTGGYYNDGTRNIAQLIEWNGYLLKVDRLTGWYWTGDTVINSVAISQRDAHFQTEIVTGGQFNDGTRNNAQVIRWSGSTLTTEHIKSWYWTSNTSIKSVCVGELDNDSSNEIVTGGAFYDGTRLNSQLTMWGIT